MGKTRSTGNSGGIFQNVADLQQSDLKVGTRAELLSGERYRIDATDLGGGLALDNGNFANPIASGATGVESFKGRTGVVVPLEGDYTLDLLGDVTLSVPSTNDVITFNGSEFVNAPVPVTQAPVSSDAPNLAELGTDNLIFVPDAISDGTVFGRSDATWVRIPETLPDAPNDGKQYGRQSQAWTEIVGFTISTYTSDTTSDAQPDVAAAWNDYANRNTVNRSESELIIFNWPSTGSDAYQYTGGQTAPPWTSTVNNWVSIGGGAVSWGSITGDINDQTDLANALDAKGAVGLDYTFLADTADSDPLNGNVKLNDADQSIATEMYVSAFSGLGNDLSKYWQGLQEGDLFNLIEKGAERNFSSFEIVGPIVNNTTYFTVPIANLDFRGPINANQACQIFWSQDPRSTMRVGGTINQVLAKQSGADFDVAWVDVESGGGGVPEAPQDGSQNVRQDAAWVDISAQISNVVASGIGNANFATISDLDALTTSGFFNFTAGSTGAPPLIPTDGIVINAARTPNGGLQIAGDGNGQVFFRFQGFTDWKTFIGGSPISTADPNTLTEAGFYTCDSAAANIPLAQAGVIVHQPNVSAGYAGQTFIQVTAGSSMWYRNQIDGTWGAWAQLATLADIPDAGVVTFNGRDGAVVPVAGDYAAFYVATFNGRGGAVVPVAGDYSAFYATTAQGALADTALQSVPVATNNAFGGFKYTFSGGVLNLITV